MEYLNSYVSDGNGNKRYFRDRSYEILSWRFDEAFENEDLEDGPPVRGNVIFDLIGKIKILF